MGIFQFAFFECVCGGDGTGNGWCVFLVKHKIKLFALHTNPVSDYSEVCQLEHLGCLNEYFITHTQIQNDCVNILRSHFFLSPIRCASSTLCRCRLQFHRNEMRVNKLGIVGMYAGERWRWCSLCFTAKYIHVVLLVANRFRGGWVLPSSGLTARTLKCKHCKMKKKTEELPLLASALFQSCSKQF